jgi:hypothetical protein
MPLRAALTASASWVPAADTITSIFDANSALQMNVLTDYFAQQRLQDGTAEVAPEQTCLCAPVAVASHSCGHAARVRFTSP